jgi:predicted nucleic acid-binding Zn ribbon protein
VTRAEHPAGRGLTGVGTGAPGPDRTAGPADSPGKNPYGAPNPYDMATWQQAGRAAAAIRREQPETDSSDEQPEPVEEILYDPVEPAFEEDRFELARRTVNRSRAAARDRGLFPISAKTQARDVRDRSTSAPGYSGAREDPRDPQGIASVMRTVLGNLGWVEGVNSGRVLEEWDVIVGEQVATHCRPVSLDEGVLVVSATSSAWASQMRMLTPTLITTIEKHIGAHVISELKVTGPAAAGRNWKKGRRTVTWRGPRDTYG